jgi:regulator of PEP synthase PpsR (kinase-PPPase family)
LFRQLRLEYFDRIAAIEYTMAHDDGVHPEGWGLADIVLVGVSRSGKTPLSMYMSMLGWKVANAPIVLGLPAPPQLLDLDSRRVIGLTIDLERLMALRQKRHEQMGVPASSDYIDPQRIHEELQFALKLCRQHGFIVINVSERPIETTADEIIKRMAQIHGAAARGSARQRPK